MNLIRALLRSDYTLHRTFLPKFYFFLRVICLFYPTVFHYFSLPLRYYVAEGVRLYSQETWRVVTQTRGVQLVEQHIHKMVSFCDWNTVVDELAKSMIFL